MEDRAGISLWPLLAALLLAGACSREPNDQLASTMGWSRHDVGEPVNGFPSWYERMIHVLTNRARADPVTDLAGCSNCADAACFTGPVPPLEHDLGLNRAARFHGTNLTLTSCGMDHVSPCTLAADIGTTYPDTCAGEAACACSSNVSCGNGDSPWTRIPLFGVSNPSAENIAWLGDPFNVFYAWLHESTSDPTCEWSMQNGHRWNILGNSTSLGVGGYGGYTVQDFARGAALDDKLFSGAHYPQDGSSIELRTHWYDTARPLLARVNVEGTCFAMSLERGVPEHGTYLYDASIPSGCTRYYFRFHDSGNQLVTYPTTGSFGIGCAYDWTDTRPVTGPTCDDCTPDCAGKECGDDACGGSCGTCAGNEECQSNQCVCIPDCATRECGDDGCGSSCGTCGTDEMCDNGTCVCAPDCDGKACGDPDGCGGICTGCAECDNGAVDLGETCDPITSCPTTCDDGNSCTTDTRHGAPATCDAWCESVPIAACTNGDSCCPDGCARANDNDCSPNCGNGNIGNSETCDPVDTCPTSCDDSDVCTTDLMTGSVANCNVVCSHIVIATCASGDGCCPAGCNDVVDADCGVGCGNGVHDPGETCDPPDTCPTSCDDGNSCTTNNLTGSAANCNAACSRSTIVSCAHGDGCCPPGCDATVDDDCSATCDNGTIEPGETCDPPDTCPTSCDDGNSCTTNNLTGSAANCTAACSQSTIVSCAHGDGCCPPGCDADSDDDCGAAPAGSGSVIGVGCACGQAHAAGWIVTACVFLPRLRRRVRRLCLGSRWGSRSSVGALVGGHRTTLAAGQSASDSNGAAFANTG
ncbi:hypothetical protein ACFL6C_07125 [Myxococcota bacterium]